MSKINILKLDEFITLNKLELPNSTVFEKLVNNLSFYKDESGEIGNVNYERGVLLYGLIKKLQPKNILEFGTAKGFGTMSMAYAMHENNINGVVYTVDFVGHDDSIVHVKRIGDSYNEEKTTRKKLWMDTVPREWLDSIKFVHGYSNTLIKQHEFPKIDFFYIDASHFYEGVKNDFFISLLLSNNTSVFLLDDYIAREHFGVKKLVDDEISKHTDVTLIKTDKTNYHNKNNTTKSDYGMCFFKIDRQKMIAAFGENEIKSFLKKYGVFERRYAIRKQLNKKIPFLEKIRFRNVLRLNNK